MSQETSTRTRCPCRQLLRKVRQPIARQKFNARGLQTLESGLSIGMAEKGDVIDFERAVIVAARQAGLTISETADVLAFLYPADSRFY